MTDAPETMLAETRWLERMARSLVADPHLAADLAQDAWLALQQQGTSPRGERRPWLLGMLRNLARRTFRKDGRRRRRELVRSMPPAVEATADLLARMELHSRLLQLVRELPDSHRTPLLLRFFDDLPPRRIAARLGIPVDTVNTRIQRGLAQLRGRLDEQHGSDRRAWAALLLPQLASDGTPPSLLAGAVVAATATIAAIALAALQPWRVPVPTRPSPSVAAATVPPGPAREPAADVARTGEPMRDAPTAQLRGCVVDWEGRPVADARVEVSAHLGFQWQPDAGETIELAAGPSTTLPEPTDHDGAFALSMPTAPIELRATAVGHLCAGVGIWRPEADHAPHIVLVRTAAVAGRVVDERGIAVTDASVRIELPTSSGLDTQRGVHVSTWRTTTALDGSFVFAAAPLVADAQLHLKKVGHVAQVVPLSAASGPLTLPRWPSSFHGFVVDAHGEPIAGAVVAGNSTAAITAADGRFDLPGTPGVLQVAARGRQPTTCTATADTPIALLEPDRALTGNLRHADGAPAAAWSLSPVDATCVGDPLDPVVLEAVAGASGALIHRTTSATDGSFRLPGLADRPYRLRCVDPVTAAQFVTAPLEPGIVHTIVLPADLWLPELRLTLRTTNAVALPSARVAVQGTEYGLSLADGRERTVLFSQGTSARSDAAGTVTLRRVPRQHVQLRIQHPATGIVSVPIEAALAGSIVLPRQGELLVRTAAPDEGMWFELRAADGNVIETDCLQGIRMRRAKRWTLLGGRSPVLTVPETATTVHFGDATGERGLRPLVIRPGALVMLDL